MRLQTKVTYAHQALLGERQRMQTIEPSLTFGRCRVQIECRNSLEQRARLLVLRIIAAARARK
jgi:hypothetical protein